CRADVATPAPTSRSIFKRRSRSSPPRWISPALVRSQNVRPSTTSTTAPTSSAGRGKANCPCIVRSSASNSERLRQNLLRHVAVHVSQAEIAAGIAVGEPLVIEPQEVQDCGVQIVNVDLVL